MSARTRVISTGLIESLREAFPEAAPPHEKEIAEVLYPQEEWIRPALAGKKWSAVAQGDIHALCSDLSNLTLRAFHYYLPALLLRGYESRDEQFVWWVLAALKPDSIHAPALAATVTAPQRQAIGRFVQWASTQDYNRKEAQECARLWKSEQ